MRKDTKKKLNKEEKNNTNTIPVVKEVNSKDNDNTKAVMLLQINKGRLFRKMNYLTTKKETREKTNKIVNQHKRLKIEKVKNTKILVLY